MTAEIERSPTYREIFAVSEYRAVFAANALSMIGDMLAKVAVAVLVYDRTGSPLYSAAAFAVGYLPWVVGGPVLGALADRLPWRRTLVQCDVARAVLVAVIALPGIPLPVVLLVLFASSLLAPPFEAARSALLPEILQGERFVVGLSAEKIAGQTSQLVGFVFGGAIAALLTARGALWIDSATFIVSALLVRYGVRARPAPPTPVRRNSLTRDTVAGLRMVLGHRTLRAYMLLTWLSAGFAYAPEGLAAPLARTYDGGAFLVGVLLAASPVGTIVGGFVIVRALTPDQRRRSPRVLALLAVAPLVAIGFDLPLWGVIGCYALGGFGMAFIIPLNAMFVQAVPVSFRARTFGVAQSGLQVSQGLAVVLAGAIADRGDVRTVIGGAGAVGIVAVLLVSLGWPSRDEEVRPVPEPV